MSDHLHPEELLALLDGELPEAERHLRACAVCREEMHTIRSGLHDYLAWNEQVGTLAPAPPAPWQDLSRGMDAIDARRLRVVPTGRASRGIRVAWMLATAAALLVLAYAGYHRLPSVEAAELLEKAVAAEPPVLAQAPIRVHTRSHDFVRPRVLRKSGPEEGAGLIALFAAAGFNWQDPFGARPFADWRSHLSDKHDVVEYEGAVCRILTSSDSNPLARATLVLRTSDWAPVRETLEFRENETVDISTAQVPSEPSPGTPTASSRPTQPRAVESPAPRVPAAVHMLHVLVALHTIRADLGLVEIHEDGDRLALRGSGLSQARRDEIRQAIAGIDDVDLEFGDDNHRAAVGPGISSRLQNQKPEGPAPLRGLLESKLPAGTPVEDAVNQILDTSDSMMAQAFALRMLARRYPPEEERKLAAPDRDLLTRLRTSYVGELKARAGQLGGLLTPLFSTALSSDRASSTWQVDAERAFVAVQSLDGVLSEMLAVPPRNSPADSELKQLQDALRRTQAVVRALE